jgi:hypothetical protein
MMLDTHKEEEPLEKRPEDGEESNAGLEEEEEVEEEEEEAKEQALKENMTSNVGWG